MYAYLSMSAHSCCRITSQSLADGLTPTPAPQQADTFGQTDSTSANFKQQASGLLFTVRYIQGTQTVSSLLRQQQLQVFAVPLIAANALIIAADLIFG